MGSRAQGEGGEGGLLVLSLDAVELAELQVSSGRLGVMGARASVSWMRHKGENEESSECWKSGCEKREKEMR